MSSVEKSCKAIVSLVENFFKFIHQLIIKLYTALKFFRVPKSSLKLLVLVNNAIETLRTNEQIKKVQR